MSIANNIRVLRESHGLTQVEFGRIAGVSDKAVSTWENGTAEPRMGAIQKIADYYGIKKSEIIEDETPINASADRRKAEFVKVFDRLTSEQQQLVIATMKEMSPKQ